VREDDGGNCRQTGHQLVGGGLDIAPHSHSPADQGGIGGLRGWGLLVVSGEAEHYLGAGGVSDGWDEVLN